MDIHLYQLRIGDSMVEEYKAMGYEEAKALNIALVKDYVDEIREDKKNRQLHYWEMVERYLPEDQVKYYQSGDWRKDLKKSEEKVLKTA